MDFPTAAGAALPFALNIPLLGLGLAIALWLLLEVVGRRFRSGSLTRALLLRSRLSIAVTLVLGSIAWWLAVLADPRLLDLPRDGAEVRDVALMVGLFWTLLRWKGELHAKAEGYAAQMLPRMATKDRLFLFDVLDKLFGTLIGLLIVFQVLQLLGVSASVLIAAGGFGAAALGFGARTIVENGLSGLSIYINRPFTVGETISLPGLSLLGTVEQIGWFYTQLRDPDRQRLYVPNGVFTSQPVQNVAEIDNRRLMIPFSVSYDDRERIPAISQAIEQRVVAVEGLDPAKDHLVHFMGYGASSLDLRLMCFASSGDIKAAWALQHRLLLLIGEVVAEHGASMPFPTRTLIPAPGAPDLP
ncbi:small mechanosensitive ion channel, MscS family [Cyanobium sp. PCC 7001]|uniref:mechanosensitive ion channel family protein n=1 Tax=Cyanobium sp. PCC 7001 TaxID=180281 RepID=UPI0001804F62|nr:mechanosensitive ion channel domain-containing protein [Cyanobium sp. PCC 7001]EDY38650.1 small mechanosensitive ion channel, MscS family [Cyanobium sp. PCC 7001]